MLNIQDEGDMVFLLCQEESFEPVNPRSYRQILVFLAV